MRFKITAHLEEAGGGTQETGRGGGGADWSVQKNDI